MAGGLVHTYTFQVFETWKVWSYTLHRPSRFLKPGRCGVTPPIDLPGFENLEGLLQPTHILFAEIATIISLITKKTIKQFR
jgi:hypothetical protein